MVHGVRSSRDEAVPEDLVTEKPAARPSTIPPPVPARALAPSEIDELFSDPILLVTRKAPVRKRKDSSLDPGPMISIPIGRADKEVIAGVSSWAPPRKRRRLRATLIASLLVMASAAAALSINYVTERQQPTPTRLAEKEPGARSEPPTPARLVTVARAPTESVPAPIGPAGERVDEAEIEAEIEIEMAPERMRAVERPLAKRAVEPPFATAVETRPAPEPAAETAVAEAPPSQPAAVEPAPAAETEPTPTATSCDEVSCALDNYAGACCAKFKPAEVAQPKPAIRLPAQIDRAMIVEGMAKMKPAISRCDVRYGVRGTVNLNVKVGSDGSVADVSVASSPDAALGDCVATAIRKASFAKTQIGGSFRYPFLF
jgi:TonB family protein